VSNTQALSRYERVVAENYHIINVSTFRNLLFSRSYEKWSKIALKGEQNFVPFF
jgi:hypothetical protein